MAICRNRKPSTDSAEEPEKIHQKSIILADDGVAAGATIKAAISTLKQEGIGKLIVAVAVAPPYTAANLTSMADVFVCLETPEDFMSVGNCYQDFTQITDEDVVNILAKFPLRSFLTCNRRQGTS